MSLFNVLTRDHMEPVFIAMTELLKSPQPDCKTTQEKEIDPDEDSWSGSVNLSKNDKLKVCTAHITSDGYGSLLAFSLMNRSPHASILYCTHFPLSSR